MYHNIYEFKDICKIHCKSLEWECLTFFIILVNFIANKALFLSSPQ